jgi:uncharacterized protein (DUF2141 family)
MGSTKSTMVAAALLIALTAAPAPAPADGVGEVALEVGQLRNRRGELLVAVFRSPEGFPDGRHAFRQARIPASAPSLRHGFPGLPPGEYAILVIHDEDRDGGLDTSFLGIPTEGYGASRNHLPRFGAPTWTKNRFTVAAGQVTPVTIRLRYL